MEARLLKLAKEEERALRRINEVNRQHSIFSDVSSFKKTRENLKIGHLVQMKKSEEEARNQFTFERKSLQESLINARQTIKT
jgi:hypothetical protein